MINFCDSKKKKKNVLHELDRKCEKKGNRVLRGIDWYEGVILNCEIQDNLTQLPRNQSVDN